MDTSLVEHVQTKLTSELPASHVEIDDRTWQHTGHASSGGGAHFHVTVVSEAFEGKNPIEQHRMVQKLLKQEMMVNAIHALVLKTLTPAQWEQEKAKASQI